MEKETSGRHAEKRGRALPINGNEITVSFGPETVKAMNNLQTMLQKQNGDTILLEELASRPLPLTSVLVSLLLVNDEVNRIASETGNCGLVDAFDKVRDQIAGDTLTPDKQSVLVHIKPKMLGR